MGEGNFPEVTLEVEKGGKTILEEDGRIKRN
jgi:hypothetical protein